MKIRIFQPIVPEYRVALFEGLSSRYNGGVEVWAAAQLYTGDQSVRMSGCKFDYSHKFHKCGPLVWQSGLSIKGLDPNHDIVVINGDIHQLSALWVALKCKIKGMPVVWWGHHKTANSLPFNVRIRLWIAKHLADIFLAYTKTGIAYLKSHGFEKGCVFATGNTIDQKPIKKAIAAWDGVDRFKGKKGLLCCSVLREKVKLDQVIRVLADGRLKDVALAVIGEGPMKAEYERIAAECGVAERIIWLGATRDQMVMAPWFLSAKAFVYPGSVGLSILHSMSYGLPVIVHGNAEHQMPEYEVMEDGKTGLCFEENSTEDLLEKIVAVTSDETRRLEMSRYCQDLAFNKYSMDAMVENFVSAVEAARGVR